MRALAQGWYEWRWSQRFFTGATPSEPEVPHGLSALFPTESDVTVTLEEISSLCDQIDGFQGHLISPESVRLYLLGADCDGAPEMGAVLQYQSILTGLHRTRQRLVSATRYMEPYWGDIPEGEQIASMRSEFMNRFAPGQRLAGLVSFYADISKRVNRLLLAKKGKRPAALAAAKRMFTILEELDDVLGLLSLPSEVFLDLDRQCAVKRNGLDMALIEQKISLRTVARTGRDWDTADRLKAELNEMGVILSDEDTQTDWWFEVGDLP